MVVYINFTRNIATCSCTIIVLFSHVNVNLFFQIEYVSGDLQLLTYKAACASYMYGREFSYVAKAYSHLAKENDEELLLFLDGQRGNSLGIYQNFQKKLTHIT